MARRQRQDANVDAWGRPYIRDVSPAPHETIDSAAVTAGMVVLALASGFVIGLAVYAAMNLASWLCGLLWNEATGDFVVEWYPFVVCVVGGMAIGAWTWLTRDEVKPLEEVMAEFKATGSYRVNGVVRPVVSFLLPLVFGGSVGFEAGLTGLVAAGCCWVRDRLKAAGLRAGAVADASIAASFAAIFGTPLAGIVAGAQSAPGDAADVLEEPSPDEVGMRRGAKVVLYTAAAFGAFGGIALLAALFGAGAALPRFDEVGADGPIAPLEYLWAVPCIAVAYAMALLFHGSGRLFRSVGAALGESPLGVIGRPIVAGLALGIAACVLPLVLFPGESQCELLMDEWPWLSALVLVGTGAVKAIVTPLCLNMGWKGGSFFPCIFAGASAGYGLALLSGADPMLMVTVTTTAFLAAVTRKPLLTLAVLFLCFPAESLLWMGLAAVIGAAIPVPRALLAR